MAKLKVAKMELEQEVDTHKKRLRLHMETQVRTQSDTWESFWLGLKSEIQTISDY